jgi:hypothetical protein
VYKWVLRYVLASRPRPPRPPRPRPCSIAIASSYLEFLPVRLSLPSSLAGAVLAGISAGVVGATGASRGFFGVYYTSVRVRFLVTDSCGVVGLAGSSIVPRGGEIGVEKTVSLCLMLISLLSSSDTILVSKSSLISVLATAFASSIAIRFSSLSTFFYAASDRSASCTAASVKVIIRFATLS